MQSEKMKNTIFRNKSFSDLLMDIYDNSDRKKKQIDILINELRPLVKDASQAAMIVPLIKEYMEVGVKNDEQLIKMASVYQKFLSSESRIEELQKENGGILSDAEKKQILMEIDEIQKESDYTVETEKVIDKELTTIKEQSEKIAGTI